MPKVFLPMDLPNVFRECDHETRDSPRHANAKVHPFMVPLITELAKKRPLWTFVSRRTNSTSHPNDPHAHFYSLFEVRVGDEVIGEIDRDVNWRDHAESYEFDCRQLRAVRSRGSSTKTKNLKKAVKLINENFHPLSYGEHVSKAHQTINSLLYRQQSSRKYAFSQAEAKARPYVMGFLMQNWDKFVTTVTDPAVRPEVLELQERYTEAKVADTMHDSAGKVGAHVVLLDNKYVVQRAGSNDLQVYAADTLPDDLRGPIGMLKLAGEGAVIEDIGARGEGGALFVIPTKVEDE